MMTLVTGTYRWLNDAPRQRIGMAAFQRLLAAAILFRVSTEFRFAGFLWGPDSIGNAAFGNGLDSIFVSTARVQALLAIEGAAALALLIQKWTQVATIVLWFTFSALFFRTAEIGDGGDNLTYLALMFMMVLLPAKTPGVQGSLRVWLHNLAVVAVVFQVCVVYFIAGISKVHGDAWNNGTALYLISQVEWFSLPSTRSWFTNGAVATAAAYSTMFFQIWFPIAMVSRLKGLFLLAAMGFHLGIAVTMGLITFSLVMAGADLSCITDDEYRWFKSQLADVRERIAAGWQQRFHATATLFLDGNCAVCARTGTLIRTLDVTGRTAVLSFRTSDSFRQFGIDEFALEQRMHCVVHGRRITIWSGFDVVELLCCRLPPLWPVVPIVLLMRAAGVGPRLYDYVARRRYLIGGARGCGSSCAPRH